MPEESNDNWSSWPKYAKYVVETLRDTSEGLKSLHENFSGFRTDVQVELQRIRSDLEAFNTIRHKVEANEARIAKNEHRLGTIREKQDSGITWRWVVDKISVPIGTAVLLWLLLEVIPALMAAGGP